MLSDQQLLWLVIIGFVIWLLLAIFEIGRNVLLRARRLKHMRERAIEMGIDPEEHGL